MFEHEHHANWIIEQLNQAGFEAFYVGGCVRDTLLGRSYKDVDLTTSASVAEMKVVFPTQKMSEQGIAFGSLSFIFSDQTIEVTTYREDGISLDARHPQSVHPVQSLLEDCRRRDFTINAIAYHPQQGLLDPCHGQVDLEARCIRCVGEPSVRFKEDGLRILRAMKFAGRLDFKIESKTALAMNAHADLLIQLSVTRVRNELSEILLASSIENLLMDYQAVWKTIVTALAPAIDYQQGNPYHCYDLYCHTAKVVGKTMPSLDVRYAALFHDLGKVKTRKVDEEGIAHFYQHEQASLVLFTEFAQKYALERHLVKHSKTMIEVHDYSIEPTLLSCWEWLYHYGESLLLKIIDLKKADNQAKSKMANDRLEKIQACERIIQQLLNDEVPYQLQDLTINGDDLKELEINGLWIGKILKQLLREVALEGLENQPEVLLKRSLVLKG